MNITKWSLILLTLCGGLVMAQDVDDRLKIARALISERKFDQALAELDKLNKAAPTNVEVQVERITALAALKKADEVGKITKTSQKNPAVRDLVLQAQGHIAQRNMSSARTVLKSALAKDANHYLANYQMAMVEMRERNNAAAIKHLETSIAANKDFPESYFDLGYLYFREGNTGQAKRYWRGYLDRVPRTGERYKYANSQLQKLGG